ncbi:hypothetical protein [Alcaligenes sp. Marseille-Q7550]
MIEPAGNHEAQTDLHQRRGHCKRNHLDQAVADQHGSQHGQGQIDVIHGVFLKMARLKKRI